MNNNIEKRKYIRVAMQDIVKCELFTIPKSSSKSIDCVSQNISAGGLLFSSKSKYELGDLLRLEISAHGWEKHIAEFYKPDELSRSKPLIALATVVRIESLSENNYDIGVSLAGIDEYHQRALDKYINLLLKQD